MHIFKKEPAVAEEIFIEEEEEEEKEETLPGKGDNLIRFYYMCLSTLAVLQAPLDFQNPDIPWD